MREKLGPLAQAMRRAVEAIPQAMRQEAVIRQNLVCLLFTAVSEMGLTPVAAWKPPKSTRDRIDLVGVDASQEVPRVEVAFVVDPVVELPKVRALEWVEAPHKIVVSFAERADKVEQSTFFLNSELTHLYIYAAQ